MRSSVGLAVGGLALAAAMAGCGSSGGNGVQKTVARVACLSRAEAVGQTNVVRAAFASGDVASPAYLRTRVFGKSVPRSAYLDAQGRLKPLLAMPREAQDEFLGWVSTLEKSQSWADRLDAAGQRARRLAACPTAE